MARARSTSRSSPAGRGRSTRDRPAKPPLSERAVVDAALAVLKAEGASAVTMRRVAAALDTGPASLYAYVDGREGLQRAMLDRVVATIELEVPGPSRWREQLHSLLRRTQRALVAHPGVASMTLAEPPTTDTVMLLTENLLGLLLAGGDLDPQRAAWAADVLISLAMSAAREDEVRRPDGDEGQGQAEALHRTLSDLSADRFPLLTAHAKEMVAGGGEARFRFAIDTFLDGLLLLEPPSNRSGPRRNVGRRGRGAKRKPEADGVS